MKERIIESSIIDLVKWCFIILLSFFLITIGINRRIFLLVFISLLIFFVYVILAIYDIVKISYGSTFLSVKPIIEKRLDEALFGDFLKRRLEDNKRKMKKVFIYSTLILPFLLGLFILIGALLEMLVLSLVIPGFVLAIYLVILFFHLIYEKKNIKDEDIKSKSIIRITKNFAYLYGEGIMLSSFGIKSRLSMIDGAYFIKTSFFFLPINKIELHGLNEEEIKMLGDVLNENRS